MIIKEEWIKVSNPEDIKDDHEKETVVSRNFIENIISCCLMKMDVHYILRNSIIKKKN